MSRLAVFNHPDWNSSGRLVKSDAFIIDTIVALVKQAPAGTQIRVTVSGWDVYDGNLGSDPLLKAFKGAIARGCDLKMVLPMLWFKDPDDPEDKMEWFQMDANWKVIEELQKTFRGNIRHWPGSQELCKNINHNKFVLFSQLDDGGSKPKWVIANSSCNWRYRDRDRPNDMIVVSEDRPLYLSFLRYWQALWMAAGKEPSLPHFKYVYDDVPGGVKMYYLPLPDGSSDPVMDLLNSVIPTAQSKIYLVMATWGYGGRGKTICDKLLQLANQGCDVRIIAHHELQFSNEQKDWTLCKIDPLSDGEPMGYCETSQAVWEKIAGNGKIRWAKSASHSKYILVDAPLVGGGSDPHKVLLTGPLNFGNPVTYSGCAMAENVVVIKDDADLFQRYIDNWNWLCTEAWFHSPVSPCAP